MVQTETFHSEQLVVLSRDIQSLWEERRGGEFLRIKDRFSELCQNFSLEHIDSPGRFWVDAGTRGLSSNLILDILVLQASLLHGASEHTKARLLLGEIEDQAKSHNCFRHYQLEFELGLADGISGKYHNAIRHWQRAREIRSDALSQAFCDVNIALAQEYLGFIGNDVVENLVRTTNALRLASSGASAVEQVDALIIRKMMQSGDIRKTFEFAASHSLQGEAAFQVLFASELPWANSALAPSVKDDLRNHLALNLSRYSNEYRFNTIQGIEESSPIADPRLHDQIQRFYLWVWRWLASGDLRTLASVQRLLNVVAPSITSKNLSTAEYGYAKLALGWLCLFANLSRDYWEGLASSLTTSSQNANVLVHHELLFLEYLFARRDDQPEISERTLQWIQSHEASLHGSSLFPKMIATLNGDGICSELHVLQDLCYEIKQLKQGNTEPKKAIKDSDIVVDVLAGKILIDDKMLVNDLAARTIAIMLGPRVMMVQDFASTCLRIRRYNPSRHDGYLAKALTSINKILGDTGRFSRRQDYIRFEYTRSFVIVRFGDRSRQIQQLDIGSMLTPIRKKIPLQTQLSAKPSSKSTTIDASENILLQKDNTLVSASELAVAWNCSKVTVNRRIASLLENGTIERVGRGPTTKYVVPSSLLMRR